MPSKAVQNHKNTLTGGVPAALIDWDVIDPGIEYQGEKITLPDTPEKMGLQSAIDALERRKADEETILHAVEIIEAFPLDAAVAFAKAMRKVYGWASPVPSPGWFPTPPVVRTVQTGPEPGDSVQIFWGSFKLPNIENPITIDADVRGGQTVLIIHGKCHKRDMHVIQRLAEETRAILKVDSVYRGKAIKLPLDNDGQLQKLEAPTFIGTKHVDPKALILNDDVREQITASLWTPITHTKACRAAGIPLKRGVLLEGTYGIGKSLAAIVTARQCVDNGWTFVLVEDVRGLREALTFAQRYQPAVVFSEDIDRVIEERDQGGNDLLNTIDGVVSKGSEIITVLTTNHVEKIDRAMLRPGRLDAVISVRAPDAKSVKALINLYSAGRLAAGETLERVAVVLAGQIPATIREVVERSKLSMISRDDTHLIEQDLITSAESMTRHLELLNKRPDEPTVPETLAWAFRTVVGDNGAIAEETVKRLERRHEGLQGNGSAF